MPKVRLFRETAESAYEGRLYGNVSLVNRSHGPILLGLLTAIALFASLLVFCEFTLIQKAGGWVETEGGTIEVKAGMNGVVRSVSFSVGDTVTNGQMLMHLERARVMKDGEDAYSTMESNLLEKAKQNLNQTESKIQSLERQLEGLSSILQIESEKEISVDKQAHLALMRLKNTQKTISRYNASADQGLLSTVRLEEIRDRGFAAELELEVIREKRQSNQARLTELRSQIFELETQIASAKAGYESTRIENLNDIVKLQSERYEAVMATSEGEITQLFAKNGQFVSAGETLASIRSSNESTLVHLLAPLKSFGFIGPGAKVVIKLDAYPYTKHGVLSGKVLQVRELLPPAHLTRRHPSLRQENYYEVVVEVNKDGSNSSLERVALVNGMTLSADIILEKHRIISWLVQSINEGFGSKN